ncbi:hypothetical protein GCM10027404_33190 [Arthrobacter tumbae]|uniref:EAL domain-containing protein n=1 Tax=Arthrobacter tumbae TaxID=163874 RepID=UPI00195B3C5F|nr:EAL domain-containing protein [Arthrobacter tumbae]MBM7781798.1 EAL domain-containing protein (putative c-di-GMP-specific phosphodiesterase class I) [Arthrobacter tumbae]
MRILDGAQAGWASRLALAADGHGLSAAYQPIIDCARGTVVGYEALARFPGYTEKNPETWFAAARALSVSDQLEAATLRAALSARRHLPPNCFLTVNISPDLLNSELIRRIWREEGNLAGLVVELTEQAAIDSYRDLEPDLNQLRSAGALIAVDDAGAGYAGLRHLLSLRPAIIKIDRDLIHDVDRDEAKRALIEMLGTFASRVDAWILAEGVETAEELDALAGLGVPLVQGYYLGRPGDPWARIAGEAALRLASRNQVEHSTTLRAITEPAVTVHTVEEAAGVFASDPRLQTVVLVDGENRRPVCLVHAAGAAMGVVNDGMRANLDTPVHEALARCMTRPDVERFDPVLVTDNAGRFAGIARMERLITALTAAHETLL